MTDDPLVGDDDDKLQLATFPTKRVITKECKISWMNSNVGQIRPQTTVTAIECLIMRKMVFPPFLGYFSFDDYLLALR